MDTTRAGERKDKYRIAVIWSDGSNSGWEIDSVSATAAKVHVRQLTLLCIGEERTIVLATVCRVGSADVQRVTLPVHGRTIHWAACGQYDVTVIDGRVYCIDEQGEPYVNPLDGNGESYVEHEAAPRGCGMTERCEIAAQACAAHAGVRSAEHVFDRI